MRLGRFTALCALSVLVVFPASVTPASAPTPASPLTQAGPAGRVAIAGPWIVRGDRADAGLAHGWERGFWTGRSVTIPFAPNADPDRLTGRRGERNFAGSIAWYRTSFTVARPGRYAIDFQSVNHRATVWVDGRRIGRSHEGEFQPFTRRFTARRAGSHLLVVRADYGDVERQNLTGWHRTWFNFGGINREVTVRRLARSDIVAPKLFTTLDGGAAVVRVTARIRNRGPARTLRPAGTLTRGDQSVALAFGAVRVPRRGVRTVSARVRVGEPALWSPEDPRLYDLVLTVPGETAHAARVGLRELTWSGRRIFLNGGALRLRGASLHEDAYGRGTALTGSDMDELVRELKAVGANVTRAHHPLAPALLERLDAAGILVYQEIGSNDAPGGFALKTPALRRAGRARIRQTLDQLQLHPSIFAWSLANEVAGRGSRYGQRFYVDNVARELHRSDPGRMVAVDVWGTHVPDSDRGLRLYRNLDAIGLTNYDGWYNDNAARGGRLRRIIRASVDDFARAFPGKVLLLTEFGAEANPLNRAHQAGGYDFQSRLLREHLRVYGADPRVAGTMIWILRDFAVTPAFRGGSIRREVPDIRLVRGIAQKGLFDYRGRPKPAAAVVRRIYARWPGPL